LIPKNDTPDTVSGVYYITVDKTKILGPADTGATKISATPTIYPVVYKLDSTPATTAGPFSVTLPHHTAIDSAADFKISLAKASPIDNTDINNLKYDSSSANKRYLQFATSPSDGGDSTFKDTNGSYSGAIFDLTTSAGVALNTNASGPNPLAHTPNDLTYITSNTLINLGQLLSYNESGLTATVTGSGLTATAPGTKYTFQTNPDPVGININIRYVVFDNQHKGFFQLVNTDSTGLYTWLCYNTNSQASTLSSSTSLSTTGGVYTVTDLNDCVDGLGGANDSYWAYAVDANNKLIVYSDAGSGNTRQYLLTNKSFPSQTSSASTATAPNGTPGAFPFLGTYRPVAFTALDTSQTISNMTIESIKLDSAQITLSNVKVVENSYGQSKYSPSIVTYATIVFNLDGTFLTGNTNPQTLLSNASPASSTTITTFPQKYLGVKFTFTCDLENGIINVSLSGTTPVISSPVTGSLNSSLTVSLLTTTFYAAATAQTTPFITAPLPTTPSCTSALLQTYPTYPPLPIKIAGFNFVDPSFKNKDPMKVTYDNKEYTATFVPVSVSESSYTNSTLQSLIFSAVDVNSYTDLVKGTQAVQSLAVVVKDIIVNPPQLVFNNYNQYPANTHWLFKVSQNAANAANQSNADKNNPYFVWVIGQSTNPSTYFFVTHMGGSLTLQKILNILPGAGTRQVIDIIQQYLFTNAPKPTAADPSLFTKWSLLWKFRDDDHLIDGSNASGNEILIVTADDTYYVTYTSATTNSVLGLTTGKGPSSPSSTNPGSPGISGTIKGSSPPYKTTTNTSRLYCYYTFAGDNDNPVKEYADTATTVTNAAGSTVVIQGGAGLIPVLDPSTIFVSHNSSSVNGVTISNPTMSTNGPQFTLTTFKPSLSATAPTSTTVVYNIVDTGDGKFSYSASSSPIATTNPLTSSGTGTYQTGVFNPVIKITTSSDSDLNFYTSLVSVMGPTKTYTYTDPTGFRETIRVLAISTVTQPQLAYNYYPSSPSATPSFTAMVYITETGSVEGSSTFNYIITAPPIARPSSSLFFNNINTGSGTYTITTPISISVGTRTFV
jgi:hypothetical protein